MRTTRPSTHPTTVNGTPSTAASSHRATAGATGTSVPARAATTRYSRPMSWADGFSAPSGGRRSTQVPVPSVSR